VRRGGGGSGGVGGRNTHTERKEKHFSINIPSEEQKKII